MQITLFHERTFHRLILFCLVSSCSRAQGLHTPPGQFPEAHVLAQATQDEPDRQNFVAQTVQDVALEHVLQPVEQALQVFVLVFRNWPVVHVGTAQQTPETQVKPEAQPAVVQAVPDVQKLQLATQALHVVPLRQQPALQFVATVLLVHAEAPVAQLVQAKGVVEALN